MANTIKLGNGNWATKEGSLLAYNDERNNFKPLPFTTTRDTIATVVNKQGLIETVKSGIPRIDFSDDANGALLLEPSRTNLVKNSETLSGYWVASGATIENTNIISPDGTANVKSVKTSATGAYQGILKSESSAFSDKTLTVSTFAKKSNNDYIFFYNIGGVQGSQGVWFNINNGTIGTNLSGWTNTKIEDYGNGWYRCSSTLTYAVSGTDYIYIQNANSDDTINSDINQETYIWGTQLEQGSYATSYIPTSGTTQTRSGEDTIQDLSNLVSLTEGVIYIDTTNLGKDSNSNIISQHSVTDTVFCLKIDSSNKIAMGLFASGVNVSINSTSSYPLGARTKIALHYKSGNMSLYINGSLEGTNGASFTLGSGFASALRLIDATTAYNAFPSKSIVSDFRIYNTALTDQELINLTTI